MGIKGLAVILGLTTAAQLAAGASPSCGSGIVGYTSADKKACCPVSCGRCGGSKCDSLPGGAAKCCASNIKARCATAKKAPCLLGSPTPKPTSKPTPKPSSCGLKCDFDEKPCGRSYSYVYDPARGNSFRVELPDTVCCGALEMCASRSSDKIGGSTVYECRPVCKLDSCNGNGECIIGTKGFLPSDDLYMIGCRCKAGWTGTRCDVRIACLKDPKNDTKECSGHGSCAYGNTGARCICEGGWKGKYCETKP